MAQVRVNVHINSDSEMKVMEFKKNIERDAFVSIEVGSTSIIVSSAEDADRLDALIVKARDFLEAQADE